MTEPTQEAIDLAGRLFAAIAHGDDTHRKWLSDELHGPAALIIQAALDKREAETDARIVAWLRGFKQRRKWSITETYIAAMLKYVTDAIERGEHKEPKQ